MQKDDGLNPQADLPARFGRNGLNTLRPDTVETGQIIWRNRDQELKSAFIVDVTIDPYYTGPKTARSFPEHSYTIRSIDSDST